MFKKIKSAMIKIVASKEVEESVSADLEKAKDEKATAANTPDIADIIRRNAKNENS